MNSSGEKKKRHAGLKVLIVIAVLVFLFLCLIGFITDFLWFKELDYVSVFLTKLLTQLKIGDTDIICRDIPGLRVFEIPETGIL